MAIPSLKRWNTYAGGTSCPSSATSYQVKTSKGNYYIHPICRGNRVRGYELSYAGVGNPSGGLWRKVGMYSRAASAAKAAREDAKTHTLDGAGRRRR